MDLRFEQFVDRIKEIFKEIVPEANKYLSKIGDYTLYLDEDDDTFDYSDDDNCVAMYESNVGDWSEITIAINYINYYDAFKNLDKENYIGLDFEDDVKVTIYHEMAHGIIDRIRDMYENAEDLEMDMFFQKNKDLFLKACTENEEDVAEEFGLFMGCNGQYSPSSDLDDLVEAIGNFLSDKNKNTPEELNNNDLNEMVLNCVKKVLKSL